MNSETLGQGQVEPDFLRDTATRARDCENARGAMDQATTETSVPVAKKYSE